MASNGGALILFRTEEDKNLKMLRRMMPIIRPSGQLDWTFNKVSGPALIKTLKASRTAIKETGILEKFLVRCMLANQGTNPCALTIARPCMEVSGSEVRPEVPNTQPGQWLTIQDYGNKPNRSITTAKKAVAQLMKKEQKLQQSAPAQSHLSVLRKPKTTASIFVEAHAQMQLWNAQRGNY